MDWFVALAKNNPFIAFFVVCAAYYGLFYTPRTMWRLWLRHRSIKAHGWPDPPLDADGDVITDD